MKMDKQTWGSTPQPIGLVFASCAHERNEFVDWVLRPGRRAELRASRLFQQRFALRAKQKQTLTPLRGALRGRAVFSPLQQLVFDLRCLPVSGPIGSTILVVCIVLLAALASLGAMSLSNFDRARTYQGGFTDVPPSAWYFASVRGVYEHGIMVGKDDGVFDPAGRLTLAETIKIAATLHKVYHTGSMDFPSGSPWYAPYVDYARNNDIPVGGFRNLDAAATRADFALIIAGALPDEAITPMNRLADGAIPDVRESFSYGQAVYRLYRAGVLTGADRAGTFSPGRTISRAEAAAIIMRVVDADARLPLSLAGSMTSEQIYENSSSAVFYIEVFDSDDQQLKTGSGFFISETGIAITNYHVIIGASSAKVTLYDGEILDVVGIYDYNWRTDATIIQVEGEGFSYLELADSAKLLTGATVYALGSPLGLQASFSRGIVSQALREIEGMEFIQLDAAISSGSSGGALLDTAGRVVGVTSATLLGTQNINLAVPINFFTELSRENHAPLDSILLTIVHYADFYPAPDFGAIFDVSPFNIQHVRGRMTFAYRLSDLPGDPDETIDKYKHILMQNQFEHTGYLSRADYSFYIYYNPTYGVRLVIGIEEVRGYDCITIGMA